MMRLFHQGSGVVNIPCAANPLIEQVRPVSFNTIPLDINCRSPIILLRFNRYEFWLLRSNKIFLYFFNFPQ